MAQVNIFVEEPSVEMMLHELIPKISMNAAYEIFPFQGKPDLLKKLPDRLRGYATWQGAPYVVVLVDRHDEDCRELKARLEAIAQDAGLATRATVRPGQRIQVANRIVITALEAWFFGDVTALRSVYPKIPATLNQKAAYRDPDGIGRPSDALERLLKRHGYLQGHLRKIEVAEKVAPYMDPCRNRSHSFQIFCEALITMIGQP